MKGGAKVVVIPHRHEGVFIAQGSKEDVLCTLNGVPGESVYGEKRISVEVGLKKILLTRMFSVFLYDFSNRSKVLRRSTVFGILSDQRLPPLSSEVLKTFGLSQEAKSCTWELPLEQQCLMCLISSDQ